MWLFSVCFVCVFFLCFFVFFCVFFFFFFCSEQFTMKINKYAFIFSGLSSKFFYSFQFVKLRAGAGATCINYRRAAS